MLGCSRWRKLREVVLLEASRKGNGFWGSSHPRPFPRCLVNCLHPGSYVRKRDRPFIGVQKRYKWDRAGGGDEHLITREIRVESNCPRGSKQMELLFTNRPHQLIPPFSSNHDQNMLKTSTIMILIITMAITTQLMLPIILTEAITSPLKMEITEAMLSRQ